MYKHGKLNNGFQPNLSQYMAQKKENAWKNTSTTSTVDQNLKKDEIRKIFSQICILTVCVGLNKMAQHSKIGRALESHEAIESKPRLM